MHINSHTNTLFHYTSKLNNIFSILQSGLRFSYCKEQLTPDICIGIPMISFCDIPINRCIEHCQKYGYFGIGLSKDFLLKEYSRGLGIVNYVVTDTPILAALEVYKQYLKEHDVIPNIIQEEGDKGNTSTTNFRGKKYDLAFIRFDQRGRNALASFLNSCTLKEYSFSLLGYMKPYKGQHKKKIQLNYDECEWRIVLPYKSSIDKHTINWFWSAEEYDQWKVNNQIKTYSWFPKLEFTVNDINYILIRNEKNRNTLIKHLFKNNLLCKKALSKEELHLLVSKIISFEQIKSSF